MEIPSPEQGNLPPDLYGVMLDRLDDRIWQDIVRIYFQKVWESSEPPGYALVPVKQLIQQLKGHNFYSRSAEFRFGSLLSGDSKLTATSWGWDAQIISFDFYHNSSRHRDRSTPEGQAAQEIRQAFTTEVETYLLDQGLAEPIYR